jgi:hypothetical protein
VSLPPPPSAALNFVAGVLAGAGINLVTSLATGPAGDASTGKIASDALLWVISAGCLTWAAQIVGDEEREADRVVSVDFSAEERREIRDRHRRVANKRARLPFALTLGFLAGAVLFLPNFVHWRSLIS